MTKSTASTVFLALAVLPSVAVAQEGKDSRPAAREEVRATANQGDETHRQGMERSPGMEEMSSAMTSMARTCELMMKREMAYRPWIVAAGAIVGTLLVVALALFVVLELQWIHHWRLRLKAEKAGQP